MAETQKALMRKVEELSQLVAAQPLNLANQSGAMGVQSAHVTE